MLLSATLQPITRFSRKTPDQSDVTIKRCLKLVLEVQKSTEC